MNTPTPTPRTDAAWNATFDSEQISAGQTARALRECSQQLETELAVLTAERDAARARAELAEAERDALSKLKARLINALEHYENCVIAGGKNPARDAIAAALKEGAK